MYDDPSLGGMANSLKAMLAADPEFGEFNFMFTTCVVNKLFNLINWTPFSGPIKYDYYMTEQVVSAFRGLCFPQYDTKFTTK